MRDGEFRWLRHNYPLVDLQMHRQDCLKWLAAHGWSAPKSACTFCPYHSDGQWLRMQQNDPKSFEDAVTIDRALRVGFGVIGIRGQAYLHSSRTPLETVDFAAIAAKPQKKRQLRLTLLADDNDGFRNECGGHCGV